MQSPDLSRREDCNADAACYYLKVHPDAPTERWRIDSESRAANKRVDGARRGRFHSNRRYRGRRSTVPLPCESVVYVEELCSLLFDITVKKKRRLSLYWRLSRATRAENKTSGRFGAVDRVNHLHDQPRPQPFPSVTTIATHSQFYLQPSRRP